ncbi:unnamed protein product [Spirodela intermedia]|uniref:Uncharacterized protein n=1 Tax=Spirodela intermedia TaxID=51605 RepID=A0A7I8J9W8_SPIIN|nr:unnamed protein product [Spirodela intermedia]CAA6666894.1 unnamed protein product [Spirodela intermedia]
MARRIAPTEARSLWWRRSAPGPAWWSGDPVQALASARHEFGEHGGVNMSIEASATFTVMEPDTMRRMFSGELGPDRDFFIYSRHFNPTVLNLGRQMAALEGTEAAYCTASGMSAISSVLLQVCGTGGHIVASRRLYGGTYALMSHFLSRACGSRPPSSRSGISRRLCAVAHEKGVMVVVDNTFSPMVISPARMGADVVVHSVSKFISGGADVIAGAICGPASLVNSMMNLQNGALMLLGPTMNAKVAFEIAERLPHLGLRMKEHCRRALAYAERMQKLGLKVVYPGLPSHPQHELFKTMANPGYGFGGMLCLDMGTEEKANRLMHHLQNTTQTLMSCSGSSTSSELSAEEKELAGVSPGLVRMSIGYSGTLEQRWAQFEKALNWMQDESCYPKN